MIRIPVRKEKTSFCFADSNGARLLVNGISFPSCKIEQMAAIAKNLPIPYHTDVAILCFSVSTIQHVNNTSSGILEEKYRKLIAELKDHFSSFLIIGARPNSTTEIGKFQKISSKLDEAFRNDPEINVVDIFSDPTMLKSVKKMKSNIIHFNPEQAKIFSTILEQKINTIDTRRVRNKNRRKKKKIKIDTTTVADKLNRKTGICEYTKSLYKKYKGKNYIENNERNLHEIFKIILTK